TQSERFDPAGKFIRRYLPVLAELSDSAIHAPWKVRDIDLTAAGVRLGDNYPLPAVDHAEARERTLQRYAVVKKPGATPKYKPRPVAGVGRGSVSDVRRTPEPVHAAAFHRS